MPSPHARFDELYARLNTEQREAVDTIEGPVMVIAGPGTGKTQILTLRIANIMRRTDVPPSAILALTFTNAAAANMRARLVTIVGSEGYRVAIHTFHSFANHIIERYPERFPEAVGASSVSEVEQLDTVRALIDQGGYELLAPLGNRYHFVPTIVSAIGHLKKEGYGPEAFREWVEQGMREVHSAPDLTHTKGPHKGKRKVVYEKRLRALHKDAELARLFERYEATLRERRKYDFDDALLLLIRALSADELFLRELQEEYHYFLVDEHQDTNGAQNKILELLASFFDEPNLCIVGDEKQAIFRFQGASLANFLYFEKRFRNVRRITLTTNYRSHQGILDAAHGLIAHARESIPAPLVASAGTPRTVGIYRLNADDEELLYLAEAVRTKLSEGVPPHELCVLVRTNRDVAAVRDYFERLSIPCIVESGHGVLDDSDVRALNRILEALADLSNDDSLVRLLFIDFLGIALEDAYAILRDARERKVPLFESLTHPAVPLAHPREVHALARLLASWKRTAENESFLVCFEQVVRESGLLTHIEHSPFHVEKFDKLVRLFDEVKAHVHRSPHFSATDYKTFLTILGEHGITLEAKSRSIVEAVRIMTAHRAKGLEFDYVFIVRAYDGHWGGRKGHAGFLLPYTNVEATGDTEETEDERRLFFVALTRARKDVSVSYSVRSSEGRERVPSQFIEEIPAELRREYGAAEVGVENKRPPLFVAHTPISEVEKYLPFVRAHFNQKGLSATALISYLNCPWEWFYHHFFHTQFLKSVQQKRGTAVHRALQAYFNERNRTPGVPAERLRELFHEYLAYEELPLEVHERVARDTSAALLGWHGTYANSWPPLTINELRIEGVLLDDVVLTGSLDKLECLDGGNVRSCHEVTVVDYKTGKPKTRNEIEGRTSARGAGNYKLQLVFYALLLSKYRDGWYRMREAQLDFVEPNERGAYKKESFIIQANEILELSETVRRVAKEIRSLSFWSTRCGDETCESCALRDLSS